MYCEFPKAARGSNDEKYYERTKARALWFAEKSAIQGTRHEPTE